MFSQSLLFSCRNAPIRGVLPSAVALVMCSIVYSGVAAAQQSSFIQFRDEFGNGSLGSWDSSQWIQYKAKASGASGAFDLGKTEWGNTLKSVGILEFGRQDPIGALAVPLSTSGAMNTSLVKGAELKTKQYFNPPQFVGQAVEFEARLKIDNFLPGTIVGFYTYEDGDGKPVKSPDTNDPVRYSDEIDFEYVGKRPNEILTTAWNNWQRFAGGIKDGQDVIGNFGDSNNLSPNHNGSYTSLVVNPRSWHTIKIRWIKTSNGYAVEWYMKQLDSDNYGQPIRQVTNVQSDEAMQIHINVWAPGNGVFPEASDSSLQANSSPSKETKLYVDWLQVTRLEGVSAAAVLSRTSTGTSTPPTAPPAGVPSTDTAPSQSFSFGASLTPYGPDTNTRLTATALYLSSSENYDLTYRFSVNGRPVQESASPDLDLALPGFGDHGDVIDVSITAKEKNSDNYGYASNRATVVNTVPTADNVTANTRSGQEVIIPLSGSDIDGDPLTFERVGGPTNGTGAIFLDGNGRYKMRYISRSGFVGVETVRFVSRDSLGRTSAVATMTINVSSGGSS